MKRYLLCPFVLVFTLLISGTAAGQANPDAPVSEPIVDASSVDQEWNLEILTFHDENWNRTPDQGEANVDATGLVTYEGGEQTWQNDVGVRARVEVPRGIPLRIHSIEEVLEAYGCWDVTYTLPAEGRWILYVPCHIRWYMLIPWAMNWG